MKIFIFHANAGQGHLKIAQVIQRELIHRGLTPEQVVLEDALDSSPAFFRTAYPFVYYQSVKNTPDLWGWTYEQLDRKEIYRWVRPLRSTFNRIMAGGLLRKVIRENPDLIICTHFLSAQLFAEAKRRGQLKSKLLIVVTDFLPHSFWVNDVTDYYWVMGEEGKASLLQRGVPVDKIMPGGIPVHENFKPTGQKKEVLKKHGLSAERFTILMTSGGFGLGHQAEMLSSLAVFKDKIQCLVVCGYNKQLEQKLAARSFPFPVKVFGFIDFMPELMEASDLIIAKSGGSTTSEALCKLVPMVIMDPIPGQETRNAQILKDHHAAFFMEHPEQIQTIMETIFKYPDVMKSKIQAIEKMAKPNAAADLATFVLKKLL